MLKHSRSVAAALGTLDLIVVGLASGNKYCNHRTYYYIMQLYIECRRRFCSRIVLGSSQRLRLAYLYSMQKFQHKRFHTAQPSNPLTFKASNQRRESTWLFSSTFHRETHPSYSSQHHQQASSTSSSPHSTASSSPPKPKSQDLG